MKSSVRFLVLMIPSKLRIELKCTFDEKSEYRNPRLENDLSVRVFPWLTINIIHPFEPGNSEPKVWNPNDGIGVTTYSLPVFIENLQSIYDGMKIPELYKYTNSRLELNEEAAEKIRKVFLIGNTTVELSAIVIEQNDNRIEGIKMKFNNEMSTVALSINEVESILYNLKKISMVDFAYTCYFNHCKQSSTPSVGVINPVMVDIAPISDKSSY